MANYKPLAVQVAAAAIASGTEVNRDAQFTTWKLALLEGTALSLGNGPMASIAILVWESGDATTGPATHTTFTDALGKFGVTVRANRGVVIKAYDN